MGQLAGEEANAHVLPMFWPLQILFNGDGTPGGYWFSEPICEIYNKLRCQRG